MSPLVIRAAILLAVLAGAFGAGWAAQGWRLGKKMAAMERDQAEAVAIANETARLKERAMTKKVEGARNEAAKRETGLRRDADASRRATDSLRGELAELRRQLPNLAADACHQRADTLGKLLGACAEEYQSMAERADRHVNDEQTLMDSWPK